MKVQTSPDNYSYDSEKLPLYSWAPSELNKHQVEEYMSQLPNNKVPRIGSVGERYRQQQLNLQLPKQDFSKSYCKYLTYDIYCSPLNSNQNKTCDINQSKSSDIGNNLSKQAIIDRFKEFVSIRNEFYLDVGVVKENRKINQECYQCKREIDYGELAVYSPKLITPNLLQSSLTTPTNSLPNSPPNTSSDHSSPNSIVQHSRNLKAHDILAAKSSSNTNGYLPIPSEQTNIQLSFAALTKHRSPLNSESSLSSCNPTENDICWHPACFVCQVCRELLVDLTHCVRDGKLFCERHFAETFKARCADCDELIFTNEYTKAMNKDWHNGHFCCKNCKTSLTGKRYIVKEAHQYCLKCYEDLFANYCKECKIPIGTDSKDISYKDKHWHEKCFVCALCKTPLVDKTFASRDDKIYCTNCYDTHFASHCDGCGEVFKPGTKKMEYKGQQWHEKCFCCCNCKVAIGTNSFIPKDNKIYCLQCYEDKFATRCTKCNKVISSNGVTYKNQPYHRECFLCTNCSLPLSGQKFACKDEKPYCTNCFAELFAKRCYSCQKPITGSGGTKFVSFEDRNWHNECFTCSNCKTSLVGKGFIMDGPDVLCPECAKAKLQAKLAT